MGNDETLFQSDDEQSQAQKASLLAAPSLEGYQLLRKLGSGAFGEVWGGIQKSTGQRVAVKFFLHRKSSELNYIRSELERLREVCDHPSVVGLIDADLEHEPPYFVMPWLARSLEGWVGTPSAQQAAKWLKQLAQGLQHTHDKGLLHCDLKPSNVMLDEADLVRLADFGQSRQQGQGVVAWGTLGYMAPEQALLGSEAAGSSPSTRWDVYGLGATFYRLLTGRCPYLSDRQLNELQALPLEQRLPRYRELLLASRLTPAHALHPKLDQDLSDLLGSCLHTDPNQRVSGMALILQDLERRRRGEPLLCRQPWSLAYRIGKWARRPALVVSALLSAALLAGGLASYRQQQASLLRQTRLLTAMLSERGVGRLREGLSDEGSLWLASALEKTPDQKNLRRALAHSNAPLVDLRPQALVFSYHPDGSELVYRDRAGNYYFAGSEKKIPLSYRWTGQDLIYSPDGRYLALICQDGQSAAPQLAILLYDCQTHQLLAQPLLPGETGHSLWVAFDESQGVISFHPKRGQICRWNLKGEKDWSGFLQSTGRCGDSPDPSLSDVSGSISPNGRWLLAQLSPQSSCLIDLQTRKARSLAYPCSSLLEPFSARGEWLVLGDGAKPELLHLPSNRLHKPEGGSFGCFVGETELALIDGKHLRIGLIRGRADESYRLTHNAEVVRVIASPDGKLLLSQTEGGMLWLWDLTRHSLISTKPGRQLDSFGFVGDGKGFYSTYNGLHQWAIQPPKPIWSAALEPSNVVSLKAVGSLDWSLARQASSLTVLSSEGKTLTRFSASAKVHEASLAPTGLVALETEDSFRLLWNLPNSPREQVLKKQKHPDTELFSNRLAFGGRGELLALAGTNEIEVWDTGKEPATRLGQVSCPNPKAVALSPDGKWLAALSGLDLLETAEWRLWTVPELKSATVPSAAPLLRAQPGILCQLQFAPSGAWLLARNNDAYATLSIPNGDKLAAWNQGSWITQAIMAPSGSTLFQPRANGLGEFRSLPQGKLLGQPLEPGAEHQFAFTADFSAQSDVCALASQERLTLYDPARAFAICSLPCRDPFACALIEQPSRLLIGNKQGQVECWNIPLAQGKPREIRRRWEAWTGLQIDEETASVRPLDRDEWLTRLNRTDF